MNKDNICSYHYQILAKAEELIEIANTYGLDDSVFGEIKDLANGIYNAGKLAMQAGKLMEDRLKVYREGIEKMGFERKKEGKNERI